FHKIEDEKIMAQLEKLHRATQSAEGNETSKESSPDPILKPPISFEDFEKMDLRTGRILAAQKVKNTDRLLHWDAALGFDKRTIVSGIAAHFQEEELAGRQVLVLANLAPRKLRGIMSQGMILMAEDAAGNLVMVSAPDETEPGSSVR